MTEEEAKHYIGGEYNIAEVSYDLYSESMIETHFFKIDKDLTLQQNDLVVVKYKRGLCIAKVVKVFENNINNADMVKKVTAWVVDKIDEYTDWPSIYDKIPDVRTGGRNNNRSI